MARKKKQVPTLSREEYAEWIAQQEVVERDGATYIIVDGNEYPLGLEPNPALTGRDLLIAQKKEEVWMWAFRFGLLGIIVVVGLIVFFSITA